MENFVSENGKLYLNDRELPPLPFNKKVKDPVVIEDKIYVSGYELCGCEWKRTFKAWICKWIGWWLNV